MLYSGASDEAVCIVSEESPSVMAGLLGSGGAREVDRSLCGEETGRNVVENECVLVAMATSEALSREGVVSWLSDESEVRTGAITELS